MLNTIPMYLTGTLSNKIKKRPPKSEADNEKFGQSSMLKFEWHYSFRNSSSYGL